MTGDAPILAPMVPPPKPIWRAGKPLPGSINGHVPPRSGDLQWLADDYRHHAKCGRWYQYDERDRIWFCIDPFDRTAINGRPDVPPSIDDIRNF